MFQNSPYSSIMFTNHFSYCSNGHVLSHQDYQRVHEQSEAATSPSPGNLCLLYSTLFTSSTRNTTVDISFKLEKVQMTPGSLDSIMYAATWFAAFRTSKLAA